MKNFIVALQFLTMITLSSKKFKFLSNEELANSMVYFPIIGLMIGSFLVIINYILGLFLPDLVVDVFLIISLIFVTRGLHLDGFADTIDGFSFGGTKEEILTIMSDSRIGAMGAIGIFCLLITKLFLIYEMPIEIKNIALIIMPVLGRWVMVMAAASSNYAKENVEGLGKPFTDYVGTKEFAIATIIMVLIGWGLFSLESRYYKGVILILIIYIINLYLLTNIKRKLNGITGDILGALCEITEVLVLFLIMGISAIEKNLDF
ncbi:MAG: adenosylcobinamide-GDP ribazoletransferase [bacterium]